MTNVVLDSTKAPAGADGEISLASGTHMSMRLWRNEAPHDKAPHRSAYETLGYVISGRAELTIDGETSSLSAGTSWLVPAHAEHTYRILETFTAVECTAPPQVRAPGRDERS